MKIIQALDLEENKKHVISLVGGGGKSTTMDTLAKELKTMGKKVLVTTTTALFHHEHYDNDKFILGRLPDNYRPRQGTITLLGAGIMDNILGSKIKGVTIEDIEEIYIKGIFDIILIEGDGARLKPIKAPADHEPVVPKFTTMTIGLIGLDSIGMVVEDENVHRPELLASLLEVEEGHAIGEKDIVKLVLHDKGLFKDTYGKKVLFLNKAHNEELLDKGRNIRNSLSLRGFKDVFVTDIKTNRID